MALRCVLFSSDTGAVEAISQALRDLEIEGEHCPEAVAAVEKVCKESFQIVIVDWDQQPEAGALLQAVRERKAAARPLTLAIVSEDASVAKALQAGANSILRKPIVAKQVVDTLTRARDLLRARDSGAQAAAAGAAGAAAVASTPSVSANLPARDATTLRAGEFLVSSAPATQFDTESEMQKSLDEAAGQGVDPLTDLEPVASAVVQKNVQKSAPKYVPESEPVESPEPAEPHEKRTLEWYLNRRGGKTAASTAVVPAPPPPTGGAAKPELLGFDQSPAQPGTAFETAWSSEPKEQQKKAAELFAYIAGENDEPEKDERPRRRLGKGPILFALALAACAIAAAPQAPWSPQLRKLWGRGQKSLHAWLNPQVVAPAQAPASHENFGRAGDEYKLPVAETIPDATTDPSQIRVTPMVDPTAKKPNTGADPNLAPADAGGTAGVPAQSPLQSPAAGQDGQAPSGQGSSAGQSGASQSNSGSGGAGSGGAGSGNSSPDAAAAGNQTTPAQPAGPQSGSAQPLNGPASGPSNTAAPDSTSPSVATQPAAPKNLQPRPVTTSSNASIPSSLKSQMASMTPDASGNKAPETAMASIEPVVVPEATERTLAADQPGIAYPASAKGQQGTVTLQVLIGRDGTVQDAKFLQGSLAFARTAIDGVKQWKFKPYIMNGRPVSVQTNMTIGFKPQ
jgi:TonB family protein